MCLHGQRSNLHQIGCLPHQLPQDQFVMAYAHRWSCQQFAPGVALGKMTAVQYAFSVLPVKYFQSHVSHRRQSLLDTCHKLSAQEMGH